MIAISQLSPQTAFYAICGALLAVSLTWAYASFLREVRLATLVGEDGYTPVEDVTDECPIFAATVRDMPAAGELVVEFADEVAAYLREVAES